MYSLPIGAGRVLTSTQLIAKLDPTQPLQAAHIETIRQLDERGTRYSNEDFDVLAAAHRAIGRTEVAPYEAGFVRRMALEAAHRNGRHARQLVAFGQAWNLGTHGFGVEPNWASIHALTVITLEALEV